MQPPFWRNIRPGHLLAGLALVAAGIILAPAIRQIAALAWYSNAVVKYDGQLEIRSRSPSLSVAVSFVVEDENKNHRRQPILRPEIMGRRDNLHALRIVTWFEERYPAFRGLDLTLAVREGIVKHSRDYSAQDHPEFRPRIFLDRFPPLEAQLIDLADEIAYLTADLDDGF